MCELVPVVISTCRDYTIGMHGVFKNLAERRDRGYRLTSSAAEDPGVIAREAGALRRELPMTLLKSSSCRARVCREKQAAIPWSRPCPETSSQ